MDKLLHVLPYPYLYPPKTGGQLRCFHLMDQLSRFFDVDAVSFLPTDDLKNRGYSNPSIRFYNHTDTKKSWSLFNLLPTRLRSGIKYRWWQRTFKGPAERAFVEFYPIIRELIKNNRYDFILLEHGMTMILGKAINRLAPTVIRIVDQHNIDHLLYKKTADSFDQNTFRRLHYRDSNMDKYVDSFFTCSEEDKGYFDQLINLTLPGYVVPNGTLIRDGIKVQ